MQDKDVKTVSIFFTKQQLEEIINLKPQSRTTRIWNKPVKIIVLRSD